MLMGCKLNIHYGKWYGGSPKKLKVELPTI
jgi:hypothetical protein